MEREKVDIINEAFELENKLRDTAIYISKSPEFVVLDKKEQELIKLQQRQRVELLKTLYKRVELLGIKGLTE